MVARDSSTASGYRMALRPDQAQEIIDLCDRVLQIKPDFTKAALLKVSMLLVLHLEEDAIAMCDRVLEIEPDLEAAIVMKVSALVSLERTEDAEALLETIPPD